MNRTITTLAIVSAIVAAGLAMTSVVATPVFAVSSAGSAASDDEGAASSSLAGGGTASSSAAAGRNVVCIGDNAFGLSICAAT